MTHPHRAQKRTFSWEAVNSTRVFVVIQGTLVGLAGMAHGVLATVQGNTPTGGYLLPLGIFTLIPNYLLTGLAAICVGASVIVWTIGFVHTPRGPGIFLALSILLFLVGGGVAQALFVILTWGVATQINQPLTRWKNILPGNLRKRLASLWLAIWMLGYVFLFTAIGLWLISPPSAAHQALPPITYVCWSFLGLGILFQPLTVLSHNQCENLSHNLC